MSFRLVDLVITRSPFSQSTTMVLLALAHYANDAGECYPSMDSIRKLARVSLRRAQYAIKELVRRGAIERISNASPRYRWLYRINLDRLKTGRWPADLSDHVNQVAEETAEPALARPNLRPISADIAATGRKSERTYMKEPVMNRPWNQSDEEGPAAAHDFAASNLRPLTPAPHSPAPDPRPLAPIVPFPQPNDPYATMAVQVWIARFKRQPPIIQAELMVARVRDIEQWALDCDYWAAQVAGQLARVESVGKLLDRHDEQLRKKAREANVNGEGQSVQLDSRAAAIRYRERIDRERAAKQAAKNPTGSGS